MSEPELVTRKQALDAAAGAIAVTLFLAPVCSYALLLASTVLKFASARGLDGPVTGPTLFVLSIALLLVRFHRMPRATSATSRRRLGRKTSVAAVATLLAWAPWGLLLSISTTVGPWITWLFTPLVMALTVAVAFASASARSARWDSFFMQAARIVVMMLGGVTGALSARVRSATHGNDAIALVGCGVAFVFGTARFFIAESVRRRPPVGPYAVEGTLESDGWVDVVGSPPVWLGPRARATGPVVLELTGATAQSAGYRDPWQTSGSVKAWWPGTLASAADAHAAEVAALHALTLVVSVLCALPAVAWCFR